MKHLTFIIIILLTAYTGTLVQAACPLDHILIGCNPDGEPNTLDDTMLYMDYSNKYKRSTLEGNWPEDYYKNWYYPMSPGFGGAYFLGEPGLDFVNDPNKTPQLSFDLKVECVDLSSDLIVLDSDMQPLIEQAGDIFNYTSNQTATHLHLNYRVAVGGQDQTQWFTFRVYDALNYYQPSETCTLIFCQPPIPGDVYVDNVVDVLDLEKLVAYWLLFSNQTLLNIDGLAAIDVFDGTDINRDYNVDFADFSILANYWLWP